VNGWNVQHKKGTIRVTRGAMGGGTVVGENGAGVALTSFCVSIAGWPVCSSNQALAIFPSALRGAISTVL
jgi:hypothetical protein